MASFAESYEYRCLLDISKRHLDALDRTRVRGGRVIGQDYFDNLKVSTVFAAIAVEAALNDYLLAHCLFVDIPYLQNFFGDVTRNYVRHGSSTAKIDLLAKLLPQRFPPALVADVKSIFQIRNRIVHQTGKYLPPAESDSGNAHMSNAPLSAQDMTRMLRHHEIAKTFLALFWFPGNREVQQGMQGAGNVGPAGASTSSGLPSGSGAGQASTRKGGGMGGKSRPKAGRGKKGAGRRGKGGGGGGGG